MKTRVFHSYPLWQLSGVNTWSVNLAGAMKDDPEFEHVMLMTGVSQGETSLFDDLGLRYHYLEVPARRKRRDEWSALAAFLGSHSPCVYLPNYDFHRASACGTMPANVRICSVIHSDEECYYEQVSRIGVSFDALVAVSKRIKDNLLERFSSLERRIHHIPYGVPGPRVARAIRNHNGPLRLVYCNRLAQYQKRVYDLPLVLNELHRLQVNYRLAIAGDGPDEHELFKRFESAGVSDRVDRHGRLSSEQIMDLLLRSDVFLLTSDFEGLPISLLEAMAAGCVPVAYGIASGIADVIKDRVNGLVVPHADVSAMACSVQMLSKDRNLLKLLSHACVDTHLENFTTSLMAQRYRSLWTNLLRQNDPDVIRDGRIRPPADLRITHRLLRKIGAVRPLGNTRVP